MTMFYPALPNRHAWAVIDHASDGTLFHELLLHEPRSWREPRHVCVGSPAADVFDPSIQDDQIEIIWDTFVANPHHTFDLWTRNPARMEAWLWQRIRRYRQPLGNVRPHVVVTTQADADDRLDALLAARVVHRLVWAVPLQGHLDLRRWLVPRCSKHKAAAADCCGKYMVTPILTGITAGGGVGPGATPLHPEWARFLRDQARAAEIAFRFFGFGDWCPRATPSHDYTGQRVIMNVAGHVREATWSDIMLSHGQDHGFECLGMQATGRLLDGTLYDEEPYEKP